MNFLDRRLDELDFGPIYGVKLQHMFKQGIWVLGSDSQVYPVLVRDLVVLSETDIMRSINIGRGSLNKLKETLASHGLHFGVVPMMDMACHGG